MSGFNLEDKLLGWAGLLLGLPSFLLLFFQGQIAIGLLVAALVLAIAVVLWLRRERHLPDFECLEVIKRLTIHDDQGNVATMEHTVRIKANRPNVVREFTFSGISSDGKIDLTSIRIDGLTPDKTEPHVAGQVRVSKQFNPLQYSEEKTITMTLSTLNSFTEDRESLVHGVNTPTKILKMAVELPTTRPAREEWSSVGMGGQVNASSEPPARLRGGQVLELQVNNPILGNEYYLTWRW